MRLEIWLWLRLRYTLGRTEKDFYRGMDNEPKKYASTTCPFVCKLAEWENSESKEGT